MKSVRIGTFNCENLFARYNFREDAAPTTGDGFTINQLAFTVNEVRDKRITGSAVKATKADVLALQEVESLLVLDRFKSEFLGGLPYKHRVVIDGNDPRHIDVGVLSKIPIVGMRTWRHERNKANTAELFSRDLLEVELDVPVGDSGTTKRLTLFVNHLKSMMGGRPQTHARRVEQVERLVEIVDDRFGPNYDGNFAIVGDLNDYLNADTSLKKLADHEHLVNVNDALPEDDRWTHYYAKEGEYKQLDYIWLGKAIWERAGKPSPEIIRNGLPHRASRYQGPRFDDVGDNTPKASDHCPVIIEIPTPALK